MFPSTKRLSERLQAERFKGPDEKKYPQSKAQAECQRGPERDEEKAAKVAEMWREGKMGRQIAVELGITIHAVYMQLRRLRVRGEVLAKRPKGFTAWKNRKECNAKK